MAAQAAVIWAVDQIPDADWDGYQLTKQTPGTEPKHLWGVQGFVGTCSRQTSAQGALDCYVAFQNAQPGNNSTGFFWRSNHVVTHSQTSATGFYDTKTPSTGSSWNTPAGSIVINGYDACTDSAGVVIACTPPGAKTPFNDADYQQLENALAQVNNSEWLRDLVKASCDGSTNPEGCYNDLIAQRKLLGPGMQMGPKYSTTTTTTNPDGSTSTTTTTSQNRYDYSYGDDYYDFSTTTKTDTTKDGQTSSTETSDAQPEGEEPSEEQQPEEQEPEYTFQDSELPEITPFYEQKYPDGFDGVWNDAKADFENSEFVSFMQSFVPSFSGTCPSWSMNFAIGALANFGTIPFQSLCYIFDFIKVIMLVTAVFTCRAIMFGG
ncbi:hypothetical protein E8E95_20310 [Pseudomonas sp. BN414]|nr:hypothetical protein [Pseudomonas sp. BN414]